MCIRDSGGRGPQAPDTTMLHLEGSTLEFTRTQANDGFGPADWFPGDHPTMPEIVAHGRRPDIRACALCHYPNGQGRAENAGVNGFPAEYFIQQLKDFAAGNRKSADTRKQNTGAMASIAKAMTDEEMKAAADYYAQIPVSYTHLRRRHTWLLHRRGNQTPCRPHWRLGNRGIARYRVRALNGPRR